MPAVTVGLPVYNAERHLEECLQSILGQTFEEFDVLAVLDAPTDRSEEILRDLADFRFRIVRNERNLGQAACSNLILEQSKNPLIARMDSDDVMHPERIERQYRFMNEHPEIDVLGSRFDEIDDRGKTTRDPFPLPLTHEEIRATFRRMSVVHHPTVMYRRERIRAVGGYNPERRYAEDLDLWLRCFLEGLQFANLPDVLLHYRVHHNQLMSRRLEPTLRMIDRAYATYGPGIWGAEAPDYVSGINPLHRLWRRCKRHFTGERKVENPS